MDKKRKKEKILKRCFTFVWFVFCVLSFFVCLENTSYAEVKTYKYTFDMGSGVAPAISTGPGTVKMNSTIDKMELILTVEEDTSIDVSNAARYNIINRELTGYMNYGVSTVAGRGYVSISLYLCDAIQLPDMNADTNKSIYNFLSYVAYSTNSETSRKFMKSLLFATFEEGWYIKVKENGWRHYIGKGDIDDDGRHSTRADNDYPNYVWLIDKKNLNRDFKKDYFDKSKQSSYTPFSPKYAKGSMQVINKTDASRANELTAFYSDKSILNIINSQIEKGTDFGNYFKSFKQEIATAEKNATYTWNYRENSYMGIDNSIVVDVKKDGIKVFSFKYAPNGIFKQSDKDYTLVDSSSPNQDYEILIKYTGSKVGHENHAEFVKVRKAQYEVEETKDLKLHFSIHEEGKTKANEDFFVAIDSITSAQNGLGVIYVAEFKKDSYASGSYYEEGKIYGKKVCTIYETALQEIIKENGGTIVAADTVKKESNGYVFELNKATKTIAFYKKDDASYTGMNIDLNSLYMIFLKDNSSTGSYGIAVEADPTGKDGNKYKKITTAVNGNAQYRLPTIISPTAIKNERNEKFSWDWDFESRLNAMYFWMYYDSSNDAILAIYDLSKIDSSYRGLSQGKAIELGKCTVIAQISIRDWLEITNEEDCKEGISTAESVRGVGTLQGDINDLNEMMPKLGSFYQTLFKYAKPVFMFLVFISIIYVGIMALIESGNVEKRVLLKEKLLHITYGVLLFATALLVVAIGTKYFFEAASMIVGDDTAIQYDIDGVYTADNNWIMNIIEELIKAVTVGIEWIVDKIASRMLLLGVKELNLADMLFKVESVGGVSLYPFAESEWLAYMYGYKLLATLAMSLMGVALVKIIAEIFLNAGNASKIAIVKEDFFRIIIAILSIVLVPYAFRLLLTLVNSLVLMIPVSETKFDLSFDNYGLIGSVAALIYAITELKIFLVFVVRKIMMAFLIVATPVVFGIWAISKKFRSFGLWLGELITNAFMQFSYAFVFFFLVIVLANEQNPFAILILITMIMKLSDFVRDSLQGLFSQWGGINETGVANQTFNVGVNAVKKTASTTNVLRKKVGVGMMKASNALDEKGISKGGKRLYNAGAILSGNIFSVRTEKERNQNLSGEYASVYSKNLKKARIAQRDLEARIRPDDIIANEKFKQAKLSTLSNDEIDALNEQGGIYSEIAEFAKMQNKVNDSKEKAREAKAMASRFDNILPYLDGTPEEIVKKLDEDGSLTSDNYKEMMNVYKRNVEKLKDSAKRYEQEKEKMKNAGDNEDAKKVQKESFEAAAKRLHANSSKVMKQGAQLSAMSIHLGIDSYEERRIIEKGTKEAMRTPSDAMYFEANGFDSKNFDMQDVITENLKFYKESDVRHEREEEYLEKWGDLTMRQDTMTEEEFHAESQKLNEEYADIKIKPVK